MTTGRFLIVPAVLAGGCMLLYPPIRSDLTASVEGVVGKADIHEVAGDYYDAHPESFWTEYGSRRGQMLRVRLSTSRDLVSLSHKKRLRMDLRWRFCDDAPQEVSLGGLVPFVNGVSMWKRPRMSSPVLDRTGRFVYSAILYVRDRGYFGDRGTEEDRRYQSGASRPFDLEREPRDVCVAVWLITKPGGYRTKAARIPKEDIAAALGFELPSASATEVGTTTP